MGTISKQLKKTSLLLIAFAILISIIGIQKMLSMRGDQTAKDEMRIFQGIQKSAITKITVKNKDKEHTLEKQGESWVVSSQNNFKASKEYVDEMLSLFDDDHTVSIASSNKKKAETFEVDEKNGIKTAMYEGDKKLLECVIGKIALDYRSTYLALENKEPIYSVEGSWDQAFGMDDYRNKKVLSSPDAADISSITIEYPSESFTLNKKDDAWQGADNAKLDETAVSGFISSLLAIEAEEIPDNQAPEKHFDSWSMKIRIQGQSAQNELLIGEKKDALKYAKNSENTIYLVSESSVEDITKKKQDFSQK